MFRNIIAYLWRLLGDAFALGLLIIAVILFATSLLIRQQWVPPFELDWAVAGIALVVASFRLVQRAEQARTSDAVTVLVEDAENIKGSIVDVIERYQWPKYTNGSRMPLPFSGYNLDPTDNKMWDRDAHMVLLELAKLRRRIIDHANLVHRTLKEHGILSDILLDPDQLHAETVLLRFDQYITALRSAARPPQSLFDHLSTRRFQR